MDIADEETDELGWVDRKSCNAFGGDLHFIHRYMSDRQQSVQQCEATCTASDYNFCQVDKITSAMVPKLLRLYLKTLRYFVRQ